MVKRKIIRKEKRKFIMSIVLTSLIYLKNLSLIKKGVIIGFLFPLFWNLIDLTTTLEISNIHIFDGYHLFFTILFQSITSSILGGFMGLFFQKFRNKNLNQKGELFLIIVLVFLFKIILLEKDYFEIFFVFLILTCITYILKAKTNKKIKTPLSISYIFLLTFLLGSLAIYPFGEKIYGYSGDVILVTIRFMPLVSYFLYPLTFLKVDLVRLANIAVIGHFQFSVVLILLNFYYFIMSSILALIVESIFKIFKLWRLKKWD